MAYKMGQIIEDFADAKGNWLKWKVTHIGEPFKGDKDVRFIFARRVKKDGTLGKEYLTFWSDSYASTMERHRGEIA